MDRKHKFIRDYRVTPANVHDSRCFKELLDENAADKGYRNRPLPPKQKESNRRRSRVRVRVEHVFGMMSKQAHESRKIFTKGLRRAEVKISLKNLTHDLYRFASLRQTDGKWCTH
ncbi:MAG: hypothetical protein IJD43_10270 [Thermoguttaceae bacterium]|nr:hypothetical protein [Thermoguttaceae bacterium]